MIMCFWWQVVIVCGSVGSGKSTLLYSLLQEAYVNATTVTSYEESCVASNYPNPKSDMRTPLPPFLFGSVSLCPQKPALHTGSIKSNVLFESPFDVRRYHRIMKGCCLDEDFNISTNEDDTKDTSLFTDELSIGQGGNKLSGGQRLRVGIARALYARTDIVILDDPLSALDTTTAHRVMQFLHKLCREERRVFIVATNDVHLACHCEDSSAKKDAATDYVTSLVYLSRENGTVLKGSYTELYASSIEFREMVDSESKERRIDEAGANADVKESEIGKATPKSDSLKVDKSSDISIENVDDKGENDDELGIEHFERGYIRTSVMLKYLRAMGLTVAVIILLSTFCMQVRYMYIRLCSECVFADRILTDSFL